MNLDLEIDGRPAPLRLERTADGWLANGRAASVLEVEPGVYSVLLEGRSFDAHVERAGDQWVVTVRNRRFEIEVRDPRAMRRSTTAHVRPGRAQVTAPMPGRIVRLLAAEGDTVTAGQGLLVVEAMKMQNEIKAAKSGRLASLRASVGQNVAAGETLAEIVE